MTRRGLLLNLLLPLLTIPIFFGSGLFAQTGGVGDPEWSPVVTLPNDSTIVWCDADSICYDISAFDPDATDSITMSLVSGPIDYTPRVFGHEFTTTVCFRPETGGEYEFIWRFVDRQNHVVIDTVVYTIELGTPPVLEDQSFYSESCDLRASRLLHLIYTGNGTALHFSLLAGPGSIDPSSGVITYQPDTSGLFIFRVALESDCGSDTATVTDELVLNLPPHCIGFDSTIYLCDRQSICFDVFAYDPEDDPIELSMLEGLGTFVQTSDTSGRTCFTPRDVDSAQYTFIYRAVDSCVLSLAGEALSEPYCCLDTVRIIVVITRPGELACPMDTTITLCVPPGEIPNQICLPGFTSTWPNSSISFGTLKADTLCFETDTLGTYFITYVGSDTCGHADTCVTRVILEGNHVPYVSMADDYSIELCVPETICFAATADDLDFDLARITLNYGYHNQSSGMVCFEADTAGIYTLIMTAADECGAFDVDTTVVTVDLNQMPTVALGDDRQISLCSVEEICIDAVVTGERIQYFSTSSGAYYNEETHQVCLTPQASGSYEVFLSIEDACDNVVADTIIVEVTIGSAPTITGFADSTVYLCYPREICVDLNISDLDDDIKSITVNRGTYKDGRICFVPYNMTRYPIVVTVVDECEHMVTDTAWVDVKTDQAIRPICPGDTTVFLCEPDTLCFPIQGIPDGASVTVKGIASYWDPATKSVCFYSDCCLENKLTVSATTACGTYSCSFKVSVQTNSRPLVVLPKDTTVFLCQPAKICLPVGISDIDGNVRDVTVEGATYDDYANTVCFEAVQEGAHVIDVFVTDSCGATSTDRITVIVDFNEAPLLNLVTTDTLFRVCYSDTYMIDFQFTATDGDNNIRDFEVPGTDWSWGLDGGVLHGEAYFQPHEFGHQEFSAIVTDKCGLADTIRVSFTIVPIEPVAISCPEAITNYQCGVGEFCVDIPISGDFKNVTTNLGHWQDGRWCINVDHGISDVLTIIASGECGADTCEVPLNLIPINSPRLTCPDDLDTLLCGPDMLMFEVPLLSGSGPNEMVTASAPAWVEVSGRVARVYVPVEKPGLQEITITHASEPCEPYVCSFTVTAAFNSAPTLSAEGFTVDACQLADICVPFQYGDIDGNLLNITGSTGAVTFEQGTGELCFAPVEFGLQSLTLTAVDACGVETSVSVEIYINELPQVAIDCPIFVKAPTFCDSDRHCFDLPISGNPTSVTTNLGTWSEGQLCFELPEPGFYNLEVIAEGPCNSDTCNIEVIYLTPVSVSCSVPDTTVMLCEAVETSVGMPVTLAGDNLQYEVRPAYNLSHGYVDVVFSQPGEYPVTVVAWNDCSRDSCEFMVTAKLNAAPVVTLEPDFEAVQCSLEEICLPYSIYDADNDPLTLSVTGGVIKDGMVCFTPEAYGVHEIVITATDTCGAMGSDNIVVTVVQGEYVEVTCPGEPITVSIDLPGTVRVPVAVEPQHLAVTVSPNGYYDSETREAVVEITSEGWHEFTVSSQADCNADNCTFMLQVGQYVPPFVQCVGTVDTLLCLSHARQICLPVSVYGTDVQVEISGPATYTGDSICMTVSEPGQYVVDIIAYTDRDTATCQSVVHVTGGNPPVLEMPEALDYTLCQAGEVCFDVVMEDAEFDITSINVNYGAYDVNTGRICFAADTAGLYTIEMTVADSCGNSATGITMVTVGLNDAPIVSLGEDFRVFGCALSEVCVDVNIVSDDEIALVTNLGSYDSETGKVCFTPDGAGQYELVVEITDQCGLKSSDTITITVDANSAPVIAPMADTTIYLCYPREVCLDVAVSDVDGNLTSVTTSRGTYKDGKICFVPYNMGDYRIIVTATDECGAVDVDTAVVTLKTDQVIKLVTPRDTTVFLCEPDTLCFPIGGVPDGAQVSVKGIAAWWDASTKSICFYSDCCLENKLTVSVKTTCATYSKSFTVSVQTNSRPLVLLPRDTTVLQCQLAPICLPVGISDIDGNVRNVTVDGGTYDSYARRVCFTPNGEGDRIIRVTATDACGATGTDEIVVRVVQNRAPVISYIPKDTVYKQCQPEEICVPIGITDPDGNIADITVVGGRYDAQSKTVCIMPDGIGSFCAEVTVTDACGLTDTEEICVEVAVGDYAEITCPTAPSQFVLCQPERVCIELPISGSNFTVSSSFGSWADNGLCFDADTSGSYQIRVIATAQCEVDTCLVQANVQVLEPLSVTCPPNDTQFLCGADTLFYGFTFAPQTAVVSVNAPAFISQGQVAVPVLQPGVQTITLTVSNQCGTVNCSFTVTTTFNGAPVVNAGTDKNYVECDLHEICLPVSITDPNGNLTGRTTSHGTLRGDTLICFTPTSYGSHRVIITATDSCGLFDADTVLVNYTEGKHASIQCPSGTQYASICGADTVCILAPISNASSIRILPGGYYKPQTGEVCIFVNQGGTIPVTIIADAQCESDTCKFNLDVDMAQKPVVQCPGRIDTLLCLVTPDTLRVPITATGTGLQINVNPTGFYSAGYVYLPISQAGQRTFRVIAFGTCGADTCEIVVNATADKAPVLTLPTTMTFERCPDDVDQICISGIVATDTESAVTITKVCGPGTFNRQSGTVCFVPQTFGQIEFCFEATDSCHVVEGSFQVNIVAKEDCDVCVRLSIDGGEPTPVGLRKRVAVNVETNDPIGGFDLLIGYDASALLFQVATMAGGDAEKWEYFTWNTNQQCGSGCPSGVVRFVGIADRNNGAPHPPDSAYTPNGALLFIDFQVANDQNLGDVFVPISFAWYDCADNAVSDTTGTLLFVDSRIFDAEHNLIWDEFDDVNFPETTRQRGLGVPDSCVIGTTKAQAVRCIEFINGGIKIIHPNEIDDRGDVNLNNIAYEIADAVVFTNYFIRGMQAFTINPAGQIAATDVNADGLTLTVSDLSLLIRVIIGDADPVPKITPYAEQAEVYSSLDNDALKIGVQTAHGIGAAYFVFALDPEAATVIGEPLPLPAADGFEVMAGVYDGQLRVLLYNIGRAKVEPGRNDLIALPVYDGGRLTLVRSEIVDYQSRPYMSLNGISMPSDYELMQNYPNPFNPSTTISFGLPMASEWRLTVYNITGSLVWEQNGRSDGGRVDVVWDGRATHGEQVASGVYLYRLDANTYSNTRKMILLK